MKLEILEVAGIKPALYGLGLSHGKTSDIDFNKFNEDIMTDRADKNAPLGHGHNKFLESIQAWIKLTMPRFMWSEMDTYRLMTKQSDSTMHTLLKENDIANRLKNSVSMGGIDKDLSEEQYDELTSIVFDLEVLLDDYQHLINRVKASVLPKEIKLQIVKSGLPEAWEQTRVLCVSYKTLQNIYQQRKNHQLWQWRWFCEQLKELPNSEWITEGK